MNYFEIDAKMRRLRTQRDMSQTALAKQLGVSKSVVSSYENGVNLPPYDVLVKLSQIFSVSTDYLLGANSGRSVCVDGLTDAQIGAVSMIIAELKQMNLNLSVPDRPV